MKICFVYVYFSICFFLRVKQKISFFLFLLELNHHCLVLENNEILFIIMNEDQNVGILFI